MMGRYGPEAMAQDLQVILQAKDDLLDRFTAMVERLGAGKLRQAEVRALNHVGAKALTAVKRALIAQTSLPRAAVEAGLAAQKASKANTEEFRIVGTGKRASLRSFAPHQFAAGVRVKIWGRFQRYPHTFIVSSLGEGQVFRRVGKSRYPIKKLWGPGIGSELVKDQSKAAFEKVATELEPRLRHEMERILTP